MSFGVEIRAPEKAQSDGLKCRLLLRGELSLSAIVQFEGGEVRALANSAGQKSGDQDSDYLHGRPAFQCQRRRHSCPMNVTHHLKLLAPMEPRSRPTHKEPRFPRQCARSTQVPRGAQRRCGHSSSFFPLLSLVVDTAGANPPKGIQQIHASGRELGKQRARRFEAQTVIWGLAMPSSGKLLPGSTNRRAALCNFNDRFHVALQFETSRSKSSSNCSTDVKTY